MRRIQMIGAALVLALTLFFCPARAFASSTGEIYVTLVSSQDASQGLSGATLALEGSAVTGETITRTAKTDTAGQALFIDVPAGSYTITQVSAVEGFDLPQGASFTVDVGMEQHTFVGTVTFQNTGSMVQDEAPDDGEEASEHFVDEASWYVSSFVDENGNAVGGLVASQASTSTSFDGTSSTPQSTSTGEQNVTLSWNGLSSSVSDTIPEGQTYTSSQAFSFSTMDVQSASLTVVNNPTSENATETDTQTSEAQETQETSLVQEQSETTPISALSQELEAYQTATQKDEPVETQESTADTEEEASEQKDETTDQNETTQAQDESAVELPDTTLANNIDKSSGEGTVPALERWVPDPAIRALLAFSGLIGGAIVLLLVSRRASRN